MKEQSLKGSLIVRKSGFLTRFLLFSAYGVAYGSAFAESVVSSVNPAQISAPNLAQTVTQTTSQAPIQAPGQATPSPAVPNRTVASFLSPEPSPAVIHPISSGPGKQFKIYNVYQPISLGNPEEVVTKDYYIDGGTYQGVEEGMIMIVSRRLPTYNLLNHQFQQEVTLPFAQLKVIHVERSIAIGRLDRFFPLDRTPLLTPKAIMVGDLVR